MQTFKNCLLEKMKNGLIFGENGKNNGGGN